MGNGFDDLHLRVLRDMGYRKCENIPISMVGENNLNIMDT